MNVRIDDDDGSDTIRASYVDMARWSPRDVTEWPAYEDWTYTSPTHIPSVKPGWAVPDPIQGTLSPIDTREIEPFMQSPANEGHEGNENWILFAIIFGTLVGKRIPDILL